ncbi:MAG: sensor histidine kinase [Planctomycetota bacterium]|nr:MAG: sensor histidine kinase [Planctomycetota bacterium]
MQSTSEHKELRLRKKLILLFLIFSLVPLTLVGIGAYLVGNELIYDSVVSHLQSIVLAKSRVVTAFMEERAMDLRYLADTAYLDDLEGETAIDAHVQNLMARKEIYKRIEIVDNSGKILAANGLESVADDCDYRQNCISEALLKREYIGDIYLWEEMKIPVIAISRPILNKLGHGKYALIAYVSFEHIGARLRKFEVGETGEAYLIDNRGRFLTQTRLGGRLLQDTIPEVSRNIYMSGPGISRHTDYRGVTVIGVSEKIPERNWILIAEQDSKEAFAGIRYLGIAIVIIWCVVLVLVLATALAISHAVSTRLRDRYQQIIDLKVYSESIVAALPISVAVLDDDLKILTVNRAFLKDFDLAAEDVQGVALQRLVDNKKLVQGVKKTLQTGAVFDERTLECDLDRKGVRYFNAISVALHIGSQTQVLLILNDVTERRQMDEQVQKTERLSSLGILTAGVAHELNTPLANVLLYTQMSLEEIKDDDEVIKKYLKEVEEEAKRGAAIVKELLEFSRQSDLETNVADVNEILDNLLALVKNQCHLGKIEIARNFDHSIPRIKIDLGRIQQVFMNIVANAIWAMPGGGKLTVRTSIDKKKGSLQVAISDTGIGISKANIRKIFDPFFTTKPPGEGTGLGLSVSYGIIKKLSGRISVDSRSAADYPDASEESTGTTFTVELALKDRIVNA